MFAESLPRWHLRDYISGLNVEIDPKLSSECSCDHCRLKQRQLTREAEQKARQQAEEAGRRDQEAAAGVQDSRGADEGRATASGRSHGQPQTGRSPGPPPSGSGRGQGRGASLDAANGRLAVPPGHGCGQGGAWGPGRQGSQRQGEHRLAACLQRENSDCRKEHEMFSGRKIFARDRLPQRLGNRLRGKSSWKAGSQALE